MNSTIAITLMLLQIVMVFGFIGMVLLVTCAVCREAFHALVTWVQHNRPGTRIGDIALRRARNRV